MQAFNNVLHGRWKQIDAGYGRSVLGYFGRTPEAPDPAVVKLAIEQLKLEPFDGDPLEKAPDSIAMAEDALRERKLGLTDENIFLVASAIVPGKNMELNEGIRLLTGKAKVNLPLKSKEQPAEIRAAATPVPAAPTAASGAGGQTATDSLAMAPPPSAPLRPAWDCCRCGGRSAPDMTTPAPLGSTAPCGVGASTATGNSATAPAPNAPRPPRWGP